jgi:hypothetical protein
MTFAARAAIGMVALAGLALTMVSPANATAQRFRCPAHSICTYVGWHLNRAPLNLPVPGAIEPDSVFSMYDARVPQLAGSVRNAHNEGDLWAYDVHGNKHVCTEAGRWLSLRHQFGKGYLLTPGQSHGCTERHPHFGPDLPLTPGGLGGLNPGGCNHSDTVMETCLPVGPLGRRS